MPAKVRRAAVEAERALTAARVRHLICGGIAVAAHGYERSTKDVDFLVGDEAFNKVGKIVFPRPDIPFEVDGVLIDLVTNPSIQTLVENELNTNTGKVVSLPFLVLMKLIAYRDRDKNDIVELLKLDADRADFVVSTLSCIPTALKTRLAGCVLLSRKSL